MSVTAEVNGQHLKWDGEKWKKELDGGGVMKCDENGGCPFHTEVREEHQCWVTPRYVKRCNEELRYKRCHLTPDLFPIIKAMIAGEAEVVRNTDPTTSPTSPHYFIYLRQPKEDER